MGFAQQRRITPIWDNPYDWATLGSGSLNTAGTLDVGQTGVLTTSWVAIIVDDTNDPGTTKEAKQSTIVYC